MAVRGDEVAERIEQRIREAMEKVVGDVRTSIEDVRVALHQQLDAAIQSVQADVKALAVKQHLEEGMREIESEYAAAPPVSSPAPKAVAADSQRLKECLQNIEKGTNQVEILNALLEQCLTFGSRAALLILKGESFAGWKGLGFSAHGGNDEQIKRFTASRESVPQLEQLMREEHVVTWSGDDLASRFGVANAERAVLVPMVIKDKVAAALYVDAVTEQLPSFDQHALEILVFSTGMLIDTQAIRKKVPSPTWSRVTAAPAHEEVSAAPPERPTVAETESTTQRSSQGEESTSQSTTTKWAGGSQDLSPQQTVAIPTSSLGFQTPSIEPSEQAPRPPARKFQLDPDPSITGIWTRPAAPETPAESETPAAPQTPVEPESAAVPTAAAAPARPGKSVAAELAERSSTQYVPPAGIARSGPLSLNRDDDQKRFDDARRFARLLVSEIKLYNESQVDQGRRDRDLYERLKEDIDRSRQMYEERVPDEIRKGTNYFYEELVRILADGNADILGL